MQDLKSDVLEYLSIIKKDYLKKGIEKIALFGSMVNETDTIYSDIDIAIKKREDFVKTFGAYEYFNLLNELKDTLQKKFKRKVDIFDLDSNSTFLDEIKKDLTYV